MEWSLPELERKIVARRALQPRQSLRSQIFVCSCFFAGTAVMSSRVVCQPFRTQNVTRSMFGSGD
eukprot:1013498-Amphidinium_carterae.1